MLEAETDNIWSCRKIWFHSLCCDYTRSPLALETRKQIRVHMLSVGLLLQLPMSTKEADVQAATPAATSVVIRVKQFFWWTFHSLSERWIYNWGAVEFPPSWIRKCLLDREWNLIHQWQHSEGHWPSVLSSKTDMKHLLLLKAISTSKERWEEFLKKWEKACVQWAVLCFLACSISCPCRCAFCLCNGLAAAGGWANKLETLIWTDRIWIF